MIVNQQEKKYASADHDHNCPKNWNLCFIWETFCIYYYGIPMSECLSVRQFENNLYRSLKDGQVFKMNQKLKIWFFLSEFISNNLYNRKVLAMKICDNLINYLLSVIFGGFINVKGLY